MMARQIRLTGLTVGSRRDQMDFVRAIDATGLKPIIDRTLPFREMAEGMRVQLAGKHLGKIVVEIGE